MSCDVCIPWRATPDRAPIFDTVWEWWTSHGFRVITGDSGHPVFNRAASRNAAVAQATTDEVIVADADTLPDLDAVHRAVVLSADAMVYPFDRYHSVSPAALVGGRVEACIPAWTKHDAPGGIFAISRFAYWRLGGQDPGFTQWGFEDDAFALVARELHKVIRLRADVYAFDHAEARDWTTHNPGYSRLASYRAAAHLGRLDDLIDTFHRANQQGALPQ